MFIIPLLGEKCYRAWGRDQKTFERLPWERALERCRNYGGDLVSIQSQDEQGEDMGLIIL